MSRPRPTARIPESQPLSPQEEEIMAAMKTQYAGRLDHVSENTLIRYIRGYKDDPKPKERAIEMLGKMLTWRETEQIDKLAASTLPKAEAFKAIWPSGVYGHGKEGHPILINKIGAVDAKKLHSEFSMDEALKFHIQEMESLDKVRDAASAKAGRRIYKHIAILDLKGLSMSHLGSKFTEPMKKFVSVDQDFYPETLHVMIIVNAGLIVKTAWKLAQGMLDPLTKERIKFGNKELAEYIDAANIPKIYGGQLDTPFTVGSGDGDDHAAGETLPE